jgi:hypothetical protein
LSVTATSEAMDGPALVTTRVYVTLFPSRTGSGEADLVMDRFAMAFTVVVADAELFDESESVSLTATVTLFTRLPLLIDSTSIVTVELVLAAIVPRLQVTVDEPLQLPWEEIEDTWLNPEGSVSTITTFVDVDGPLLVTVIV